MARRWSSAAVVWLGLLLVSVWADRKIIGEVPDENAAPPSSYLVEFVNFLWRPNESSDTLVWPPMKFGWKIVAGTIAGFFGAAFGSVGGVGGGGIFVPMLSLIIGFDPKTSTAMSKCMIMGAAISTDHYNLKLRHPTLDLPLIDYDLALLLQPMLMLGISIGVVFNVVFADWMVTILLIILFIVTSTKAFMKGVEAWKKETLKKKEAIRKSKLKDRGNEEIEYSALPSEPSNSLQEEEEEEELILEKEVPILENVCWKQLGLLVFVWMAFLVLQILKNYTVTCSVWYWILNLLQIPVSVGVTLYEAITLYKGKSPIASSGSEGKHWTIHQLFLYSLFGVLAGVVGGLLGIGGGSIMGPLFLELGVPPQVASATATFAMTFSSSMSVVEYYLLHRFPVPYAVYFIFVAAVAAYVGQHIMSKLVALMGRASIIIFILASTIFISAFLLGGVGISRMIDDVKRHEYMGFDNLCKYQV